jgi:hypothetical protein
MAWPAKPTVKPTVIHRDAGRPAAGGPPVPSSGAGRKARRPEAKIQKPTAAMAKAAEPAMAARQPAISASGAVTTEVANEPTFRAAV